MADVTQRFGLFSREWRKNEHYNQYILQKGKEDVVYAATKSLQFAFFNHINTHICWNHELSF